MILTRHRPALAILAALVVLAAGRAEAQPKLSRIEAYKVFTRTTPHTQGNVTTYTTDTWTAPSDRLAAGEKATFALLAEQEGSCSYRIDFGDGTAYFSKGAEVVDRFDIQSSGRVARGYVPPPRVVKSFASPGVYQVTASGLGLPACVGTASLRVFVGVEPTPTPLPPTISGVQVPLNAWVGDLVKITIGGRGTCGYKVTIDDGDFVVPDPGHPFAGGSNLPATALQAGAPGPAALAGAAPVSGAGAASRVQIGPRKASYSDRAFLPAVVPKRAVWKSPGTFTVRVDSTECTVIHGWGDPGSARVTVSERPRTLAEPAFGGLAVRPTPTPSPRTMPRLIGK